MPFTIDTRKNTIGNLVILTGSINQADAQFDFKDHVKQIYSFNLTYDGDTANGSPNGTISASAVGQSYISTKSWDILEEEAIAGIVVFLPDFASLLGETVIQIHGNHGNPSRMNQAQKPKANYTLIGRR